jgi:hypothetical protein
MQAVFDAGTTLTVPAAPEALLQVKPGVVDA